MDNNKNNKIDSNTELLIRIDERTGRLQAELKQLGDKISTYYVRKEEFEPIKRLIFGLVAVVLMAIVAAVLRIVIVV